MKNSIFYLDALLAGVFAPLAGALRRLLDPVAATDFLLRVDEREGPAAEDEAGEVALEDDFDEAGVADRPVVIEVSPLFSVRYFGFWTLGVDGVLLAARLILKMASLNMYVTYNVLASNHPWYARTRLNKTYVIHIAVHIII